MKKGDLLFVEDIRERIGRIEQYTTGMAFEEFFSNPVIQDAVVRNLEVIGEASRNISAEYKDKYPAVPWSQMIGMRNILIHAYRDIDLEVIWRTIVVIIPEVKKALPQELS